MKPEKYSKAIATNMVIANMIGTGIFTAIGYQVMTNAIPDPFTILTIWVVGGVFSLLLVGTDTRVPHSTCTILCDSILVKYYSLPTYYNS